MSIIEKFTTISNTITKIFEFIQTDSTVKEDFEEYLKTLNVKSSETSRFQTAMMRYLVHRRLTKAHLTIFEMYLNSVKKISKDEKTLIEALRNTISSVFEIKKVAQHGFKLFNLINEIEYDVISLVKMTHYRGVFANQFAIARVFKYENEHYLLEISDILPESSKKEAYRYAVSILVENPSLFYLDNPTKKQGLETQIEKLAQDFTECFGTNEIITDNKHADNIIGMFNDYTENSCEFDDEELKSNIVKVESHKYFDVEDFNNQYDSFLEKSLGGFSSHSSTYDVGIIYDKELGLFVIPFYGTFREIFETKDYKTIEGYKDCILHFLQNDKIPPSIFINLSKKYPKFVDKIDEILETKYSLESLLDTYKKEYSERKLFSPTSVLYASSLFSKVIEEVSHKDEATTHPQQIVSKIGRNDPCFCGSGKKYKNCCQASLAQG